MDCTTEVMVMYRPKRLKKTRHRPRRLRHRKHYGIPIALLSLLLLAECAYGVAVYSSIPFFVKWRTIYVETAMSTLSHQWLATKLLPYSLVEQVEEEKEAALNSQSQLSSVWTAAQSALSSRAEGIEPPETLEEFYDTYWELDNYSFQHYLEEHPDLTQQGYSSLLIENWDNAESIHTVSGDPVLALDTANNLLIVQITGDDYQGTLAIVKDPTQISIALSQNYGTFGEQIGDLAQDSGAILAVNASGFSDKDGTGNGGTAAGSLILNGVEYGNPKYEKMYRFFGFRSDHLLYISSYSDIDPTDYLWGLQFFPALLVDGESVVDGTFGMGLQPRTCLGQTADGDVLLLVIDGRQPGYSLGCTVEDCAEVLLRYNGYQAMNLDGGSSSLMWYDGEIISSPAANTQGGRYLPNAIVVTPAN
jgi:exopolysaccharide biosynthesis protein